MAWEQNYKLKRLSYQDDGSDFSSFKINEQCYIRKQHKCGKIFGASKSCFIACPTEESLNPIVELISEKLTKVGIEPIVAVKERAYGQDIFCTKICGKIIESRFCIVILDDAILKKINIPNPNVYYEYGLMTSLRKHIIPLQKEGLKLAFNIQSYDTVKYNAGNIGTELDRATKDAIKITESQEKEEKRTFITDKTILRQLELAGLKLRDDTWFLSSVISDTLFQGFGNYERRFYVYLGKIDESKELNDYLEDLAVVLYRTEEKAKKLGNDLKEATKKYEKMGTNIKSHEKNKIDDLKDKHELMKKIYIGFVINPNLDKNKFLDKAGKLLKIHKRYKLIFNINNKMEFGDIKISFDALQL